MPKSLANEQEKDRLYTHWKTKAIALFISKIVSLTLRAKYLLYIRHRLLFNWQAEVIRKNLAAWCRMYERKATNSILCMGFNNGKYVYVNKYEKFFFFGQLLDRALANIKQTRYTVYTIYTHTVQWFVWCACFCIISSSMRAYINFSTSPFSAPYNSRSAANGPSICSPQIC